MHHHLIAHEVERVALRLKGGINHFLLESRVKLGKGVDDLPSVARRGHAEAEGEVEGLEELVLEIMALDHAEGWDLGGGGRRVRNPISLNRRRVSESIQDELRVCSRMSHESVRG